MKNRLLLIAAILGLIATSCEKENVNSQEGELKQMPITINASYKGNDGVKVDYTENGNTITATWEAEDQILVAYDGYVSTLTLESGAGTSSATFSGTITYTHTPSATSVLSCYVKDANNAAALTIVDDNIIYSDAAFLNQDGTLAGAGKCNTYMGMTTYGDGTNISCNFSVNTSMLKFITIAPESVPAGTTGATLTYKSGSTELAKATFTVGARGIDTVYMAVPAGAYSGAQTLVYHTSSTDVTRILSDNHANFSVGQIYSKTYFFCPVDLSRVTFDYTAQDGDILEGTLGGDYLITIADGATVTLSGVTINRSSNSFQNPALTCLGNATINLKEGTTNTLKPFFGNCPCIQVGPSGTTLTIRGTGTLDAINNNSGTAIGAGNSPCGNIIIEGGIINATSLNGTGIGGGYSINGTNTSSCGDITINGGMVTASGYVGIGGGNNGNCGHILISGGIVIAHGRLSGNSCIGSRASIIGGECGNITITGGNVTATPSLDNGGECIGIGSAASRKCGNITISGGTVTAMGANHCAAIGSACTSSQYNSCGNITITNGVHSVTATKGADAEYSIGKSKYGSVSSNCGTIEIGGTVYPNGIPTSPYTYNGNGK